MNAQAFGVRDYEGARGPVTTEIPMSYRSVVSIAAAAILVIASVSTEAFAYRAGRGGAVRAGGAYAGGARVAGGAYRGGVYHGGIYRGGVYRPGWGVGAAAAGVAIGAAAVGAAAASSYYDSYDNGYDNSQCGYPPNPPCY
jgi:hypothetical protein